MLRSPAAQSEKAELHHRNQEETDGGKGGEEGEEGGYACERVYRMERERESVCVEGGLYHR